MVDPTANGLQPPAGDAPDDRGAEPGASRRARFRTAVAELSARSDASSLVRLVLVPGSIAVVVGFGLMLLGWFGAARTAREIEQIPYLISGGLIGLALVVLGGLLLMSTFWVAVLRRIQAEARASAHDAQGEAIAALQARVAELEAAKAPTPGRAKRTARAANGRRATATTDVPAPRTSR